MDTTHRPAHAPHRALSAMAAGPASIRPMAILEALWRRRGTLLAVALLATFAGGAAALMMPRSFTSSVQLLIDPRGLKVMEKDISPQAREPDLSVSIIESEMRFLASDLVLQRIVDRFGLARETPASAAGNPQSTLGALADHVKSWLGGLRSMLGRSETKQSAHQAAMLGLQKSIKISRQPNTYVLDVAVTDKDRVRASEIANAIAAEYIGARFDSRADASRKASQSIDGQLDELRRKVREADARVEAHKEKHGLASSQGRLLTEQRLSELISQVQTARGETVRAKARFDEVQGARTRAGMIPDGEGLQSPTLDRLRNNEALARQKDASLAATLLPSHPVARQARLELQAAQRSVDQELQRIGGTAKAALERARATELALERQLQDAKLAAVKDSAALVELRELERVAEADRLVYQTLLVRTRELVEQQRIDPNSAVVLSAAEPAQAPNGPGLLPIVMAASLAGLGLGAALGLVRDGRDPRLRSALQLEPLSVRERLHIVPIAVPRRMGRILGSSGAGVAPSRADRALYFAAEPASPTAIAIERIHRALARDGDGSAQQIYLVMAPEPYQGKATVALNLAVAAARAGDAVLLIDADRDGLIATVAAGAEERPGLAAVLSGKTSVSEAILKRPSPEVDLLPAGRLGDLKTDRTQLDRLSENLIRPLTGYDVIVIDAATAMRDRLTLALAQRADASLLVVQEGAGQKAAVEEAYRWLEGASGGSVHMVLVTPR